MTDWLKRPDWTCPAPDHPWCLRQVVRHRPAGIPPPPTAKEPQVNTALPRHPEGRRPSIGRLIAGILTVLCTLLPSVPAHAADESITVDFAVAGGSPTYRASGWIYGMSEDASAPADHFYRDVKFRAMRAGGAQLGSPGGWVAGTYERRWQATLAQARRTIALGGTFILLPHDLWGADGHPISRFPGDNGDWADYDAFLTRVINDVRTAGLSVQWDIWNEPNITLFWNRSQAQYLELWRRSYQRIRAAFPDQPIVGPSCACVPSATYAWWTTYLDFIRANNVVPDIISWHSLPGDPVANVAAANATLDARGIPHPRPYQINEYANPDEQNPGDGSWYIARLERAGADGLRANWASSGNLHNDLGNLLVRNQAGQHLPKGEWWVYRYYASQSGQIVSVTPSPAYDAFATKTNGAAKVLVGGGGTTGNIAVRLQRLDTTGGIVQNNQVRVVAQRIPYDSSGPVPGPITIRDSVVTLTGNATTVNLPHTNADDTFTVTLLPPSDRSFQSVAVVQHSQQCLDNTNLNPGDGNVQQQYYCEGGDQQLWNFRPVAGAPDTYTLVNQQSGKCLDVSALSTADGAPVHQWTCVNGAQNQQFTLRKVTYAGNDLHDYQLVARHSGKCVDVSTISTAPRAPIHQWTCNPANQASPLNQTWRLWGR
ncbi:RICIN domain-containing protein [Nonomuraea rubra]|uniref:RICIN domain-containing protein n=1 Tax=Nonomuraea rubra TaxID=46180 RepID=UPI0033E5DC9B